MCSTMPTLSIITIILLGLGAIVVVVPEDTEKALSYVNVAVTDKDPNVAPSVCGGTLVSKLWAISAAQCVSRLYVLSKERVRKVLVTIVHSQNRSPKIIREVAESHVTPGPGDIILLKLNTTVDVTGIILVHLPPTNFRPCDKPISLEFLKPPYKGGQVRGYGFLLGYLSVSDTEASIGGVRTSEEVGGAIGEGSGDGDGGVGSRSVFGGWLARLFKKMGMRAEQRNEYPPMSGDQGGPRLLHCISHNRKQCGLFSGFPLLCHQTLVGIEINCNKKRNPSVMQRDSQQKEYKNAFEAIWNLDFANVYKTMSYISETIKNNGSEPASSTSTPEKSGASCVVGVRGGMVAVLVATVLVVGRR